VSDFVRGTGVIFSLEMRQRVRGVAWYVMLGVFFALMLLVTALLTVIVSNGGAIGSPAAGAAAFSTIIYFVLLLGSLVAPALSGNAINGDRESGTLATTQVTLVSNWQIVFGKLLAAWVTALAFLVTALPFLIFTMFAGVPPLTVIVSILVLALELGVVAAIGVGLSGIIPRPLFSIVVTYLVVAALTVGTLIAFGLGGLVFESPTVTRVYSSTKTDAGGNGIQCHYQSTIRGQSPRFDYVWGALTANPYVLLADAVPTSYDSNGNPTDLFGYIKLAERSAQVAPKLHQVSNDCDISYQDDSPQARSVIDSTTPGWLVGMIVQLILAAAALWGAGVKLRTPAGRLSKGTRIA
jgi:ABC-type transport system involved in multi-copper enzyme maturation permease subunit